MPGNLGVGGTPSVTGGILSSSGIVAGQGGTGGFPGSGLGNTGDSGSLGYPGIALITF